MVAAGRADVQSGNCIARLATLPGRIRDRLMSPPPASPDVPSSHPRYHSLMARERIVRGVERGITSPHGLIAHGRGEAFDYLLGERTHEFAAGAIEAGAALLLTAAWPVISVNGNTCALAAEELVALASACGAKLEVNIFHTSAEREHAIRDALIAAGAREVLLPSRTHALEHIEHNRRWVHTDGIHRADVVCVPLEDGDRCGALIQNGKRVITVDLSGLKLDARQLAAIESAVRSTALTEIAKLPAPAKSAGFASGIKLAKNPEFIGIWIRDLTKLNLENVGIKL